MLLSLIILSAILLSPSQVLSQTGASMDVGGTTFYNFGGLSGSSQQLGNIEYYNFSNGANATRQAFGGINTMKSLLPVVLVRFGMIVPFFSERAPLSSMLR